MDDSTWIIILLSIIVFMLIYIAILGNYINNELSMFRNESVDQLKTLEAIVDRLDKLIYKTPQR